MLDSKCSFTELFVFVGNNCGLRLNSAIRRFNLRCYFFEVSGYWKPAPLMS